MRSRYAANVLLLLLRLLSVEVSLCPVENEQV